MKSHFLTKIVVLLIICFLAGSAPALPDMRIAKYAYFSRSRPDYPDYGQPKAWMSSVSPGDVFTYLLYVDNWGSGLAHDVRIVDGLPEGLILQSWNVVFPSGHLYDVKYLGNGVWVPINGLEEIPYWLTFAQFHLEITVQLDPLYTGNQIINTARVMTLDPESDYSNNESTLVLPVVIPAPGAILLVGIGVGVVGWLRRHRTL